MKNGKFEMENGKWFFLLLPTAPAACSCRLLLPTLARNALGKFTRKVLN